MQYLPSSIDGGWLSQLQCLGCDKSSSRWWYESFFPEFFVDRWPFWPFSSSLLRETRYEECKQIKQISITFYFNKKTSLLNKSLQHTVVESGGLDGVVSSTKTIRIPRGIPHLKFHGAVVASRQSHGTVRNNEVTYSTKVQTQLGKFRFLELKNAWRFVFFSVLKIAFLDWVKF